MTRLKIVCFGPGPKFKGGIANYNLSLARAFAAVPGTDVHLISWTQQYPAIVPREFVDKSSKERLESDSISVEYITNYNNPASWAKTVDAIVELDPDIVVIQWYNAQQGLPLRYITKRVGKRCRAEVIFDLHFVVPKEKSSIDRRFTRHGLRGATSFITHSGSTSAELAELFPKRFFKIYSDGNRQLASDTVLQLFHPVYDLFKPSPAFSADQFKKENDLKENVFLFFGFIRKYKGLHDAIDAFRLLRNKRSDVSLLICGESFWNTLDSTKLSTRLKTSLFKVAKKLFLPKGDDEENYRPLAKVKELGLEDDVMLVNEFIPNEDVNKYFQVSDAILLFYERATPSGVESLSYNFSLPILATAVGHFPETVQDGYNGYLAQPADIESMAEAMEKAIVRPINREHVRESSARMSWANYAAAILRPYQES